MRTLYTLSIRIYQVLIHISSLFNAKAQKWIKGRKDWQKKLRAAIPDNKRVIWFHCASLGEFEQARPVLEKIKSNSDSFILLSFYSPSGYEAKKDYAEADYVCYMPLDTPSNANKFLEISNPQAIVFIKYEFWFNFLSEIKKKSLPCFLVSGIFRPSHIFFSWYGTWFKNQLDAFSQFYVQNQQSFDLLTKSGFEQVELISDTRFDRVAEIAEEEYSSKEVEVFKGENPLLILGSSWEKEHEFALRAYKDFTNLKVLIAPHEINSDKIQELKNKMNNQAVLWSEKLDEGILKKAQILIFDQIGLLSKLYRYADIALIGGGFGAGIHNSLEAACYGMPILFGPKYQKFQEAKDLIALKGAYSIKDYRSLHDLIDGFLNNQDLLMATKEITKNYVQEKLGSSQSISDSILSIAVQKN